MNIDRQVQLLIDNAPQDGETPGLVAAVAPVLKLLVRDLKHSDYYILQNRDAEWLLTTLSSRARPGIEKNVVYAFATLSDAAAFQSMPDPQLIALQVPVTHILFQMFNIEAVDSIVFFDTPGNLASGIEVTRQEVQNLIQTQLQRYRSAPGRPPSNLPPDIA